MFERKLAMRCVAATWCLACFVLVQSYSCTLTSALTLQPEPKPLINSVYDITKEKGLEIVVVRGLAIDLTFSVFSR